MELLKLHDFKNERHVKIGWINGLLVQLLFFVCSVCSLLSFEHLPSLSPVFQWNGRWQLGASTLDFQHGFLFRYLLVSDMSSPSLASQLIILNHSKIEGPLTSTSMWDPRFKPFFDAVGIAALSTPKKRQNDPEWMWKWQVALLKNIWNYPKTHKNGFNTWSFWHFPIGHSKWPSFPLEWRSLPLTATPSWWFFASTRSIKLFYSGSSFWTYLFVIGSMLLVDFIREQTI